jgi:predicted ATPase
MDEHMNYYEVRWKNFKGFKDTNWVKIKPITILLGANNSGKTNFIAPFLLMQQTLTSRDSNSPLIIKSNLYDGGNIQELINDYDLTKDIYFGIRYHIHKTDKRITKIGTYAPGSIELILSVKDQKRDGDIIVKKEIISDVFYREFFNLTLKSNGQYKLSGEMGLENVYPEEKEAINTSKPVNFLFNADSILSNLNQLQRENEGKTRNKKRGYSKGFSDILDAMAYNYSRVREYIGDLSYIGPIRENPHRVYEISNEDYFTVGPKGENMTNLLKKHFNKRDKNLDKWIKLFEFGDWLELEYLYGNSYSIRFKKESDPKKYTSIANSGFGASQLLPLIVQALVSPEGSLTIAEQPEIHLNPRLQCELADLFAFMASRDQKVIVETHSEYLLLRLRKLVAEKVISADDIALYFIDKKNGKSNINEIKIQEDGHINSEEWPSEFFEDSLRESLALATLQLKNKKDQNVKI